MVDFNAYVHARPDGSVFYVGKGSSARSMEFKANRNKHYKHTVAKYGAENILVGTIPCSTDAISLDLERGLIKCLRRMGVKLTNLTDGGEGVSGYRFSEDQKARISERTKASLADKSEEFSGRQKGLWKDPAYRAKQTAKITNGVRNPKFVEARRQQNRGLRYMTNGLVCVAAYSETEISELLAEGYTFGRKPYTMTEQAYKSAANRWTPEERQKQSARTKAYYQKMKGNNDGNV